MIKVEITDGNKANITIENVDMVDLQEQVRICGYALFPVSTDVPLTMEQKENAGAMLEMLVDALAEWDDEMEASKEDGVYDVYADDNIGGIYYCVECGESGDGIPDTHRTVIKGFSDTCRRCGCTIGTMEE